MPDASSHARSWNYTAAELWSDGVVHVVGVALALAAAPVFLVGSLDRLSAPELAGICVYLATLLLSLGISATYNIWPVGRTKWLLRRFDHSAIYLLIAGTYTPLMVAAGMNWMLGLVWAVAVLGVALKLARPAGLERLSIGMYLGLGWCGIVAINSLLEALPGMTLWLVLAGGVVYSVGVIFHLWESLRFHNAIWHGLVVAGASTHFAAVWICYAA